MKALVLEACNTFSYTDVPEPDCDPEEVVVAVAACGICGSDVHGADGSTGRRRPPIIMGHEAAGTIVETGAQVRGWQKGDRVTFDSTVYCGACAYCRQGRFNLCDRRQVLGVSCEDYRRDGAMAERAAVPQHILYRLPEGLSFAHAAMVEPVSIAVHAVNRTPLRLGDSALVVGAGMIGLLVVQALRAAGCGTIIAADIDAGHLEKALICGADTAIRTDKANALEAIQDATDGGADHVFEAVGIAPTVELAMAAARKGGSVTLIGNLAGSVPFPLQSAVTRELDVLGCCASCGEYGACLDLLARGVIDLVPLLSATVPLAEGAAYFARLQKGDSGLMKVILQP